MLSLTYLENGRSTGKLTFKLNNHARHARGCPSLISILPYFTSERREAEAFIKNVYRHSYDAEITVTYPVLMSIRDDKGAIIAAAGFRPAADGPLFLEQYLDAPIEACIKTSRNQIVEVGNLASVGGGASLFLFAALSAYLHHKGFSQAVVTSTALLEKRFKKIGLDPQYHGPADPDLLHGGDDNWGRYYDTNPQVLSGSLEQSCKCLKSVYGAEYHSCGPRLFPRLHYKAVR